MALPCPMSEPHSLVGVAQFEHAKGPSCIRFKQLARSDMITIIHLIELSTLIRDTDGRAFPELD